MTMLVKLSTLLITIAVIQAAAIPSGFADTIQKKQKSIQTLTNAKAPALAKPAPAAQPAPGAATAAAPIPPAQYGGMIYNSICAACHGQAKRGIPASAIEKAIKSNTGGMGSFKYLTPDQIKAITLY